LVYPVKDHLKDLPTSAGCCHFNPHHPSALIQIPSGAFFNAT